MENADHARSFEQRFLLEKLLLMYSTVFSAVSDDMGRTSLKFHKLYIGENQLVRHSLRRIFQEHIPVL